MAGVPRRLWAAYLGEQAKTGVADARDVVKRLEAHMFDRQLDVHRDQSTRRAVICTRRSGKTEGIVDRKLISMCEHPGENSWSGYVTLTKGQSRRNVEGPLRARIRELNLPIRQGEYDGQITFTHANGHRLWVGGVDDMRKSERWRGNKWWDFDIDEGGAWPDDVLSYMIEDVIEPGLSDYDGTLTINGTPGLLTKGFFYEVTTPGDKLPDGRDKRPQWSTHHWSVVDNPFHKYGMPGGLEKLEEFRAMKGWELTNPTWLREWCGHWANDPEQLVYKYDGKLNAFWEIPQGELRWVLGVDVGHDDDTAFVLTCSVRGKPHVYVVRAWGAPSMTQPQRAQEIIRIQTALQKRYREKATVAFDTGGLGKALAYDLAQTYGAASQQAEKTDKAGVIRVVRDSLLAAKLFVCPFSPNPDDPIGLGASQLLSEWSVLPWDEERKDHRKGYADHCPDALLYAFRVHRPRETWDEEQPAPGTREAIDKSQAERKRRLGEKAKILHDSSLSPGQRRMKLKRMGLG